MRNANAENVTAAVIGSTSATSDPRLREIFARRHTMRPAHLHFRISAASHVGVTTAIYAEGDPYLDSDAVFGVKSSLVEPFVRHDSTAAAQGLGVSAPFYSLRRDFILEPALVAARV